MRVQDNTSLVLRSILNDKTFLTQDLPLAKITLNIFTLCKNENHVTSAPKKSIPSAVVYYYCAWYTFFQNRR